MKKQILMILPLLLSACSPQEGEGNAVYASFYPIYDLAKRITKGKLIARFQNDKCKGFT